MLTSSRRRFALPLSYDGTDFMGWAKQPGLRTVQGMLENGLGIITRHPLDPPTLTVAGRTDAGVHARGQVAHVDLAEAHVESLRDRRKDDAHTTPAQHLRSRLNGVLGVSGMDVRVGEVTEVSADFDARFSALWRRYEYRIADDLAFKNPLHRQYTLWIDRELDVERMNAAAGVLVGLHDFASFCRPRPGATTTRTLLDFSWRREADGVLAALVRADAFCHSMVRSLTGACVAVGEGKLGLSELIEVLEEAKRGSRFVVSPAKGLSLQEVAYPAPEEWALRAETTRARRDFVEE
ncbi:tRNA pseudouridine synthase A [Lysinibacter sp. HNR]|uniref:tRNA pseudouridine synthase A n=1 Tax=Lysinibacter sp. HNR TaxID=3031408 RepID=UPI002434CE9F|nr:tRNA pseudouridine synthase A [Lysinibacter sp. HNR]WGD36717.1 tRNA pseudouridine synthase A [Lysinibacter sp. HNR]